MENLNTNNLNKRKNIFNYLSYQISIHFIIFLLFITISMIISGYLSYKQSYSNIVNIPLEINKSLSYYINNETEYVILSGLTLKHLSSSVEPLMVKKIAEEIITNKPQILRVTYYDFKKNIVWSVNSIPGQILSTSTRNNVISPDIYINDFYYESLNAYLNLTEYPVVDSRDIKIGSIEIIYDTTYLWDKISHFNAKDIFITNMQGTVLLSKNLNNQSFKKYDPSIFEKYTSRYNQALLTKSITNENISGASSYIDSLKWVLIVEDSVDEKMANYRLMLIITAIIYLIFCAFLLIEIVIINKRIFKPLKILRENSRKIINGDYEVWCPPIAKNDLDDVSQAINSAVLTIKTLKDDFDNQMNEKSQGLTDKIKEAEDMSSFMVNRELRMIDIKNENEKLKKEALKYSKDADSNTSE